MGAAADRDRPTILFAGGGSGGHLLPGLVVAEELLTRYPRLRCLFLGSNRPVERTIIASFRQRLTHPERLEHHPLPAPSSTDLKRRPFRSTARLWHAYRAGSRRVRELQPRAIVGLGGFASLPVLWPGRREIPVLLLEQNAIPGRATTLLAKRADVVCLGHPIPKESLPASTRAIVTGNPVRPEIAKLCETPPDRQARTVLVLAGSQGSTPLSRVMRVVLSNLFEELRGWRLLWQTDHRSDDLPDSVITTPWIENIAEAYQSAAVVVSRAGALTLSELACAGTATLLLPDPRSIRDHQTRNAEQFGDAVRVISETSNLDETATKLEGELRELLLDEAIRDRHRHAIRRHAIPDATTAVIDELLCLTGPLS